ncbi:hypothetical protein ACI6Q5_08305 [Xanthomonas codiaei]|uniref:Uncharacterized protein n=1 Tax=Xanthomonas codiaei TaxID=56463 RepID=A0ABW9MKZ4_9XANT
MTAAYRSTTIMTNAASVAPGWLYRPGAGTAATGAAIHTAHDLPCDRPPIRSACRLPPVANRSLESKTRNAPKPRISTNFSL